MTFLLGAVFGFVAAWLLAALALMWLAAHDPRETVPWEGDDDVTDTTRRATPGD